MSENLSTVSVEEKVAQDYIIDENEKMDYHCCKFCDQWHGDKLEYGRICSAILGRAWTSDTSVLQVLENLNGLMLTPDTVDPLNSALALRFYEALEQRAPS